jgi:hypothetical protein
LIAVALALSASAWLAGVAEDERVHLVVLRDEEAASCPDEEELAARVRARIGSEPFRLDREGRELRVGLARDGRGLRARVALFSKSGHRIGRRELTGAADCRALADDLVLAVAIAIDPLLLVRRRPEPPEPTAPSPAPAPEVPRETPSIDEMAASEERGLDRDPLLTPERVRVRSRRMDRFEAPSPASIVGRGVVLLTAGVGVVVSPTVRAEASFDYGAFDLDLGVRLDVPTRYPIPEVGGDALIDMTLLSSQVAPCLGTTWDIVTFRGCGLGEAGILVAQGVGLVRPRAAASPWVAVGGRGAIDIRVFPALGLVLTGDLVAPLVRPRFLDGVTGQVYAQPAPLVGSFGAGLEIELL